MVRGRYHECLSLKSYVSTAEQDIFVGGHYQTFPGADRWHLCDTKQFSWCHFGGNVARNELGAQIVASLDLCGPYFRVIRSCWRIPVL